MELIFQKNGKKIENVSLSGFEVNPIDTLGAGDSVFGISSLLVKNKAEIKIIALISNLVGAMKTKSLDIQLQLEKMM